MNPLRDYIKVKVETVKEVVTDGGIIIPIEQGFGYAGAKNYQAQKYAPTHGEVVGVGGNAGGVQVGDIAMFHFITEQNCKNAGTMEADGDTRYFYIQADRVVCVMRGGQLKPLNGWLLAERAEKAAEKTEGGLEIPAAYRKETDRKFRVIAIPDDCEDIAVGDVIYTEKDCDRVLQSNEFFSIAPQSVFKIEVKDVLAVQV